MNNNLEYDIEGLARFAISAEITEEMREEMSMSDQMKTNSNQAKMKTT